MGTRRTAAADHRGGAETPRIAPGQRGHGLAPVVAVGSTEEPYSPDHVPVPPGMKGPNRSRGLLADAGRGEGPTPGGPAPAGVLYVPVRPKGRCYVTCFFRTPGGHRTAVAFTSSARLLATLGQDHPWIRLSATALRSLAAPLGCTALTIDPQASVPPGSARPETRSDTGEDRPGAPPDR